MVWVFGRAHNKIPYEVRTLLHALEVIVSRRGQVQERAHVNTPDEALHRLRALEQRLLADGWLLKSVVR
jgi:hypothetical protein